MATTADIRNGATLNLEGKLLAIVEFQHVKPGKGGAFVRTKLKNIITGQVIERTFRSGEKLEFVKLEEREMQYLYQEGESYMFMDQETFEQIPVPEAVVGDNAQFMKEGQTVSLAFFEDRPLTLTLPFFIEFKIVRCDPGARGDTVTNVTKPATLETGAIVQVPLFVEQDETIRVDTRTGEYLERVR